MACDKCYLKDSVCWSSWSLIWKYKIGRSTPNWRITALCLLYLRYLMCHCFFCCAGKVLIIGGSIANFTNVAATFKVRSYSLMLCMYNCAIYLHYHRSIFCNTHTLCICLAVLYVIRVSSELSKITRTLWKSTKSLYSSVVAARTTRKV